MWQKSKRDMRHGHGMSCYLVLAAQMAGGCGQKESKYTEPNKKWEKDWRGKSVVMRHAQVGGTTVAVLCFGVIGWVGWWQFTGPSVRILGVRRRHSSVLEYGLPTGYCATLGKIVEHTTSSFL